MRHLLLALARTVWSLHGCAADKSDVSDGPASGPVRGTGEPGRDDRAAGLGQPPLRPGRRIRRLSRRGRRRPKVHRRGDFPRRSGSGVGMRRLRLGSGLAGAERARETASGCAPGELAHQFYGRPSEAVGLRRHRHQRQDHLLAVDRGRARSARRQDRCDRHAGRRLRRQSSNALANTTPDAIEVHRLLASMRAQARPAWRWRCPRTALRRAG